MVKKTVYHVGDKIVVTNPRIVVRVGYPKLLSDYYTEVPDLRVHLAYELVTNLRKSVTEIVKTVLKEHQKSKSDFWEVKKTTPDNIPIRREGAYALAVKDNFGGSNRELHFQETPYFKNKTFEVLSKRVVKTGIRCYNTFDDGCYTIPGLKNSKTHILLKTNVGEFLSTDVRKFE